MPGFNIVSREMDVADCKWVDALIFKSKDRVVDEKGQAVNPDYQGRRYRLIAKKIRGISTHERVGRGFLGTIAVVCTLGLALFSSSIRNLFTKQRHTARFGILVPTRKKYRADRLKINTDHYTPEDRAAVTIQKHIRGYLARKPLLPRALYPQYHAQCERTKGPDSHLIPQNDSGNTNVYMPQEMPGVVLKRSGRKEAIKRFHQMQEVRSILDSQNSTHLIIPKANLCQEFLVETRLPINANSYHNMGLYLSQLELFDEPVRELTRLFSRMYLSDLVSYQHNPLGHIEGVEDFIRYDNLPFYIDEENGKKVVKIGLIDLEHTEDSPSPQGLETLARIFPFHLDVIKSEASKLKIKVNEDLLARSAEKGRKYMQVGFSDHLDWLKRKGVSTDTSSLLFQVSAQKTEELAVLLEKELLRLNQGINDLFVRKKYVDKPQKNFLVGNPEERAKELAASIVPIIIGNLKAQLEAHQKAQLSKIQTTDMTESQLVSLRSPLIKRPLLIEGVAKLISEKAKFEQKGFYEKRDIAEQLAHVLMGELVKSGELFFYDPAEYTGGHDCWIRY